MAIAQFINDVEGAWKTIKYGIGQDMNQSGDNAREFTIKKLLLTTANGSSPALSLARTAVALSHPEATVTHSSKAMCIHHNAIAAQPAQIGPHHRVFRLMLLQT